jgi:hypothetical protein
LRNFVIIVSRNKTCKDLSYMVIEGTVSRDF